MSPPGTNPKVSNPLPAGSAVTSGGAEAAPTLQVKGSSINTKIAFVRDRFGPDAAEQLASFLKEAGVGQVLEAAWYPFEIYDRLLRRLAELFFNGRLARLAEVGSNSAERALSTTYSVYSLRGFEHFLGRIGALHGRFYSLGELEVELDPEGSACRLRMHGAPEYSEPDLYVASGFYSGAARFMGLEGVVCRFEARSGEVIFELRWTPS